MTKLSLNSGHLRFSKVMNSLVLTLNYLGQADDGDWEGRLECSCGRLALLGGKSSKNYEVCFP